MILSDHHLVTFAVDAREKTLRFGTEFKETGRTEEAEGVFEGVEAYIFDGDALGTILSDIEEADGIVLWKIYRERMIQVHAQCGGHAPWVLDEVAARSHLLAGGIRGFSVTSAIGLVGAVWAKHFRAQWLNGTAAP